MVLVDLIQTQEGKNILGEGRLSFFFFKSRTATPPLNPSLESWCRVFTETKMEERVGMIFNFLSNNGQISCHWCCVDLVASVNNDSRMSVDSLWMGRICRISTAMGMKAAFFIRRPAGIQRHWWARPERFVRHQCWFSLHGYCLYPAFMIRLLY